MLGLSRARSERGGGSAQAHLSIRVVPERLKEFSAVQASLSSSAVGAGRALTAARPDETLALSHMMVPYAPSGLRAHSYALTKSFNL